MARTPLEPVNPLIEEEVTVIAEGEPIEEPVAVSDNIAEDLDDETLQDIEVNYWRLLTPMFTAGRTTRKPSKKGWTYLV